MTEPDNTATRPISVAELLAKNGSIGAPAPGGRRRRRRGNADAVTVAELTGEIPIVVDEPPVEEAVAPPAPIEEDPAPEAPAVADTAVEDTAVQDPAPADPTPAEQAIVEETLAEAPTAEEGVVEDPVLDEEPEPEPDPEPETDAAATDYDAHIQQRDAEPEPVAFTPRRRAHGFTRRTAAADTEATAAEEMSPDALLDDDGDTDDAVDGAADRPGYLKSPADTLFGGDSVADEATRRTRTPGPEDIDLDGTADTEVHRFDDGLDEDEGSPFMRGLWIVVQSVLAVALGAGLFIAFDQLWKWNNIVALALSVLVILGLVVGVRVVRKTEDIASTLIAVAVGAMVTLGPLALLQST
ncbi:FUSC family protein [Mycolicibacterium bacteremicum]|uniref:FUSC family protein n=1 Tax=Mycolicibacterium bacteremicum TaxID=564198 RepID=UPI0026ED714D|nr:FUSC family protein [Mycolicibacterium bacteremicum]